MHYGKWRLIPCLQLLSILVWIGCTGEGILELDVRELEDDSVVDALVRVNDEVFGPFDITPATLPIILGEGVHVIGVDFLDSTGNIVGSSTPKIIEISAGNTARVPVSLIKKQGTGTTSLPVGRFRVDDAIFNFAEVKLIPVDAQGFVLRRSEGGGSADFGLLKFEDEEGNPTGVIRVSVEYLVKDAKWELDPQELVFTGNEQGTFFMYLGDRANGNVIFEGDFVTDPPDNLQAIIQPDGQLVQYALRVFCRCEWTTRLY